jgi:hypothetical protein
LKAAVLVPTELRANIRGDQERDNNRRRLLLLHSVFSPLGAVKK